jgi:hypothetical protein
LLISILALLLTKTVTYSGVDQTGIQNNQAYVSSELAFPTMNFNILNMMKIPLCDESLVADSGNTNECPGDGTFSYYVYYNLPKSGTESASWMASGWTGTGYIEIYAEANVNMMIGRCSMDLQTYVTASEEKGYLRTPSAATAAGISLAALAALSLLCFWCCCCMGRRKSKTSHEGEETTSFTRMNDEIPYSVNAADKKSGLKKALVE